MSRCKFEYVKLKDFGTFEDLEVDLSKLLTNVIGLNASGKSTILNALKLSLQLNDKKVAVNNYIRKSKTEEIKKAIVEVGFTFDDKPVKVYSEFSGGNGRKIYRKVITADGTKLENTRANNYLTETIGKTNLKLMFAINPKDNFVKYQDSENLKTLMEILSLDFSKEIDEMKANVKAKDSALTEARTQLNLANTKVDSLKNLKTQYSNQYTELSAYLKNLKDTHPSIDNDITSLQQKEKEAYHKKQMAEEALNKVREANSTVSEHLAQIALDKQTIQNYEAQLASLEAMDLVKKDIKALTEIRDTIKAEKSSLEADYQKSSADLHHASFGIENLTSRIRLIQSGICPTCEQATTNVNVKYNEELAVMEKTKESLQKAIDDQVKWLKDLTDRFNKAETDIRDTERDNNKKDLAVNQIASIKATLKPLKENLSIKETQVLDFCKEEDLKKDYTSASNDLNGITSQLANLTNIKSSITTATLQLDNKANDIKNLETEIAKASKDIPAMFENIRVKETALKEDQRLAYLYEMIPIVYLQKIKEDITKLSSRFVRTFGYDGIYMDLDVENKRLSYELIKEGLNMTYELMSGFETDLLNLSVVGALSLMLKVPCICVDELDAHADKTKSPLIADVIHKITKSSQVIAITHEDDIISEWTQKSNSLTIIRLSGGSIENDRE